MMLTTRKSVATKSQDNIGYNSLSEGAGRNETSEAAVGTISVIVHDSRDHGLSAHHRGQHYAALQLERRGQKVCPDVAKQLHRSFELPKREMGRLQVPGVRHRVFLAQSISSDLNHNGGPQCADRCMLFGSSSPSRFILSISYLPRKEVKGDTRRAGYREDRADSLNPCRRFVVCGHPHQQWIEGWAESVNPYDGNDRNTDAPPKNHKTSLLHIGVTARHADGVQTPEGAA